MGSRYWEILSGFQVIMFVLGGGEVWSGTRTKINVTDKELRPGYGRKASPGFGPKYYF